MKKYFKYKFENMNKWISAILSVILLISIICPVIANYYTNDPSSSTVSVNNNSQQQKEIQKETFKDINQNDLTNIIDSDKFISNITNPSETYATHFSKVSTSSNEIAKLNPGKKITDFKEFNAKDFKNEVMDNSKKIVAGDLLIDDLKNKASEVLKDNELLEKNIPDSLKGLLSNQPSNNYENINNKNKTNMFYSNRTINETSHLSNSDDAEPLVISDFDIISNLDNFILNISNYASAVRNMAIMSTTLTVLAWGVAAFYWSAIWMFGANIAFAIAATVQAGILTYSTADSWISYNEICGNVDSLKQMKLSVGNENISNIQKILDAYSRKELNRENAIKICISLFGYTNIPRLMMWFVKDILKKLVLKLYAKLSIIVVEKSSLAATSWASPISTFFSFMDFIMLIGDFTIGFIYGFKI